MLPIIPFVILMIVAAIVVAIIRSRRSRNIKRESELKSAVSEVNLPRVARETQIVRQEKETIREREIVKVRCSYCKQLYDEADGKCPHCGGR